MLGWLFGQKEEKSAHVHDWEIIVQDKIYPIKRRDAFSRMFETTEWKFTEDFLEFLKNKDISKEEIIDKLNNSIQRHEEQKCPIGFYMLMKCKSCGEIKEIKTLYHNEL